MYIFKNSLLNRFRLNKTLNKCLISVSFYTLQLNGFFTVGKITIKLVLSMKGYCELHTSLVNLPLINFLIKITTLRFMKEIF